MRQAREEWKAHRQPRMRQEVHRLVFLDETGTTTKMTRLRGRARRPSGDTKAEFAEWVILPGPLNRLCDWISRLDEAVLKLGITLPFGGSLLAVARRRSA